MIVAFLDLLGFSSILKSNVEVALDNINSFNNLIKTRFIDDKNHPPSEYYEKYPNDKAMHDFVRKTSVTSFEQMISFSDSLVLGGTDIDLFIDQLANFVATIYIEYSEPFRKKFSNINDVITNKAATGMRDGTICYHKAFPILFRGGISVGNDVCFFDEYHIKNSKLDCTSRNITGITYLNAVALEQSGKGPRLFCDQSVVDSVINKKIIKKVDEGIYEIIWTIEGCKVTQCSDDKWKTVIDRINDKMLPATINLYMHYKDKKLKDQYEELLKLVCEGIVKYALDECNRAEDAIKLINQKLESFSIPAIDKSILDGFID